MLSGSATQIAPPPPWVGILSARHTDRGIAHADEPGKLERMARYIARAPFALAKIHILANDRVRIDTPPDPRTGATQVEMDALASSVITAFTG
jgi:hypothetical protein